MKRLAFLFLCFALPFGMANASDYPHSPSKSEAKKLAKRQGGDCDKKYNEYMKKADKYNEKADKAACYGDEEKAEKYTEKAEKYTKKAEKVACEPTDGDTPSCELLTSCQKGVKISGVVFSYTGETCDASSNGQGTKASCSEEGVLTDPVTINSLDEKSTTSVDPVNVGDTVVVGAVKDHLSSNTVLDVVGSAGAQNLEIHTSCSQPLNAGDQFGSLVVEGLIPDQDDCDGYTPSDECDIAVAMKVEAEDFTYQSGVEVECGVWNPSSGGCNVGYIQDGDSVDYVLDLTPGDDLACPLSYVLRIVYAAWKNGASVTVTDLITGTSVVVDLPKTTEPNDFFGYGSVSVPFDINPANGVVDLQFVFRSNMQSVGVNVDYFELLP